MRRFHYIAVDRDGVRQSGELDAASPEAAQRILTERGWLVTQLDASGSTATSLSDTDALSSAPHGAESQPLMAVMSLRALSEELSHTGQRRAINGLADSLQRGDDAANAVAAVRSELPRRLTQLIQLGLKYNRLDWFVAHYLESTRRSIEGRHRLVTALGYPAVAGLAVTVIACFILLGIVPMFTRIFEDFGTQLPELTLMIIGLSNSLRGGICGIIMLALIAGGIVLLLVRLMGGAAVFDTVLAEIPIVGAPIHYLRLSEFCELLALLIEAQVPLPDALDSLADIVDNPRLARGSAYAARLVRQGIESPSGAELRGSGWPTDLGDIFRWSGRSDEFVQGLRAAGEIFSARSRVQGNLSAWLLEPVLLLMLSIGVGLLVIALFMPLIKLLNDLS
jgi:type II secretory pathway component PulF